MNSVHCKGTRKGLSIRGAAAAATLAAMLLITCSCGKKAAEPQKMVLPVVTDSVSTKDFPVFVSTFGSLTAVEDVNIKAQVSGKIMEAKFTEGQFVNAGDILFVIDKSPYQAALDATKGNLVKDTANHEYNKYLVEVNRALANSSALAKQTYEQYVHNANSSAGMIENDKAAIDTAQINLNWCDIKAPCSGITGKRLVDPGNVVSTADNPTLLNITRMDPIYADFTVPEKYFPQIKALMDKGPLKIQATPQGDPTTYEGVVAMIDNKVDSSNGTLGIRASIPNKERKLWPGQFVNIKLIFSVMKDAMTVPVDAVQCGSQGFYVFAMRDGKAIKIDVTTGQSDANSTVILTGDLKPGERVIKVGTMLLSPGADVMEAAVANAAFAQKMAAMMAEKAKAGAKKPQQGQPPKDAKPAKTAEKPAEKKTQDKN